MRNDIDIEYFKTKLIEERSLVEGELESLGKKNPDNKADWEASVPEDQVDSADENETADKIEELEENAAVLNALELRLADINLALSKIEKGDYGICEACGAPIEKERLEANYSAKTCIEHKG